MLFSQYIYTSWNNGSSPDKGFMVYGKSKDVTEDEDKEILATMRYKPFKSLPCSPTPLQIENDFPKNHAVFKLRSGRTCIALASYIGLDYVKDDDPRWGNYIIHAFIADIGDNQAPHLLNSGLFKTCLSQEEQDASTGPHVLEPVDIPMDSLPSVPERCELNEVFWNIVQATINAKLTGGNVFINVEQGLVANWIDTLIQVLPYSVSRTLSYSTYMLNKNPMMTVNFIHKESPTFRPEEEILNTDNYVFYTSSVSLQSPVELKKYVIHLIDEYNSSGDIFAYKTKIDEVCNKYNIVDADIACEVLDFLNGEQTFCSSKENIHRIMSLFDNSGGRLLSQIIDELDYVVEHFGDLYQEDKYSIINAFYCYASSELQEKYKTQIWNYIYHESLDIASMTALLKEYANVYSQEIGIVIEENLLKTISLEKSVKLAKEYCFANYATIKTRELLEWYKTSIKSDVLTYIRANNYDSAKSVIELQIKKCTDSNELIIDIFNEAITYGLGGDISFDFYMIGLVSNDINLYLNGVQKILSSYTLSSVLIDKMEQSSKTARCMSGKKLDEYLGVQFSEYFIERDKQMFFNSNQYTRNDLCEFYKKYVVGMLENSTADIVDQFNKKLNDYLAILPDERKLKESCAIFEFIMAIESSKKIGRATFEMLYKSAFAGLSFENIVSYGIKEDSVVEMNYQAMIFDVSLLPVTLLYKDYLWFKKYSLQQGVFGFDIQQSTEDFDFYYLNAYCSNEDRHSFMLNTFDLIIKFIVKCVDASKREWFFERLTRVFVNDKDYAKIFVKHLLSYSYYDTEHLMVFNYCVNGESPYSSFMKDNVWLVYLKKLGKHDREVLFAYLQDKSANKDAVADYIKQYKSDNRSFFEKLFSRGRKEQTENTEAVNPTNGENENKKG